MFEAEIARGAAWLDENKPGWERLIDVSTLDLEHCEKCVLGQAFMMEAMSSVDTIDGYYWAHRYTDLRTVEMGFYTYDDKGYRQLTDEWGLFIKARFDSGMLSDEHDTVSV